MKCISVNTEAFRASKFWNSHWLKTILCFVFSVNFSYRSNQDVEIDPLDKDPLEPVQLDSDDAQVQKNLMHTALASFTGGRTREIHRVKNYDMVCSKERDSYSTTPKFHSLPLKNYHPLEGEERLPSIILSDSVLSFQGVPIGKGFIRWSG